MKKTLIYSLLLGSMATFTACSDDDKNGERNIPETYDPEEVYAGGKLGTTFNVTGYAFAQPSPAVDEQGFTHRFQMGEYLFERDFNQNKDGAFHGLGPIMVRNGCLY
ncbi:MAG: hypothetical protein K2J86_00495, partial [Prevotella sp.]|nr:hypothetical protein [Prevotella sp.]